MDGNKSAGRRKKARACVQNVLIAVLVCSAVYLVGRSGVLDELYGGSSDSWLSGVISFFQDRTDTQPAETPDSGRPAIAAQPVRIAIRHDGERFAAQYDTLQVGKVFDGVGGLIGEALASAQTPEKTSERAWRRALQRPGIYLDFMGDIPLEALYTWLVDGDKNPNLTGTARRILLAQDSSQEVCFYYQGTDDRTYYISRTAMRYEDHMKSILQGYGGNGAAFAFEYGQEHIFTEMDPYVLILSSIPSPGIYRASNPLMGLSDDLLEALQKDLSFKPQGNSAVYPVPGGITIREGRETLNIGNDGIVVYHAPEQATSHYLVSEGDTGVSDTQVIEATRKLASAAGGRAGMAQMYLMGLETLADGSKVVRFGYSLEGAAVQLRNHQPAAEFVVQDGQITDYKIQFRNYEATGEHSLLMRERQAIAAMNALNLQGRELIVAFADDGNTASAGWIAA